jgi:hypothetical protein
MDRRTFLMGFAGSPAFAGRRGGTILEAVYGAHLPQRLVIERLTTPPNWLELRRYDCADPRRLAALQKPALTSAGIRPLLVESTADLKYLIPFDSMAARNGAWTLFDADPEWHRLRGEEVLSVSEVTIYRPLLDPGSTG